MTPRTHFARQGDARIAYQVLGRGPVDLVVVPGFISHLDLSWAKPSVARMFHRLASFSRLVIYDKAGTGISDPIDHMPTLEERMDEVLAVLDAVGSERAALLSLSEGALMSILFAATFPERTLALALYGAFPCGSYDEALPAELREPAQRLAADMLTIVDNWGDGLISGEKHSWNLAFFERAAANPAMARAMVHAACELDLRSVLGAVRVPTVVLHRSGDPFPITAARWMSERIPGARFVELPGAMHRLWGGDTNAVVDEVERLVAAAPADREPERALVTILSADLAPDPAPAATDRPGSADLRGPFASFAHAQFEQFRGRRLTSAEGVLAAFDGPVRAVRCAYSITSSAPGAIGRPMRAGVHIGECSLAGHEPSGPALELSTRLAALAGPGEVLVSSEVKNLVAGSGLSFVDRGEYELDGAGERLRVHAPAADGEGALQATPRDPSLARRTVDFLSRGERMRLAVARRAPAVGRAAARLVAEVRRRRRP